MKYNKGDLVVYGSNGMCKIDDVQKMTFPMETEEHTYYVLKPVGNKNSILFVPSHKEELVSKMRYVLNREEIDNILSSADENEIEWIENNNVRGEAFKNQLKQGDPEVLLRLIRCLYRRKKKLSDLGKKLTVTDDTILSSAEKLVCDEFAYVLGISENEVGEYIRTKLGAE